MADRVYGIGRGLCAIQVRSELLGSFLFYYLDDLGRHALSRGATGSTFDSVTGDDVAGLSIPLPPLPTQRAIASYLDRETARIGTLIEKKERLLELLEEKRTALITRAVTKGLDPDVPMKDSGVEWLGEVPAHWEVVRINHLGRRESGHTPDRKHPEYWDGGIPWVSLNDSSRLREVDVIEETTYEISPLGLANSSARLLPRGTVVFSRDATVGLCGILGREMAVSQHFVGWVCGGRVLPDFLLLVLRHSKPQLERLTMGATISTIGLSDIALLLSPVPPTDEQARIVHSSTEAARKIDALSARITRAIALLKEYRSALISAAVTGQIEVPDAPEQTAPSGA